MSDIISIESSHTSGMYRKQPIIFERGEGALLWDADGNEYLDCNAGHGVANIGHAHPKVAAAITKQAGRLITLFETFHNDQRAILMEKLAGLVPGLDRIFFCNSGTEAVEAAIKFARLSTGRKEILAAMRSFHGRTMGSLSATWNKNIRQPFEPMLPGYKFVPFNNLDKLEAAISDNTAALILEVIQGEGGIHIADPAYLQAVRQLCDQHGVILILDEIQSGFARSGKMFAFEHAGITPDLVCTAKAIAGGVPMGAVLIGPAVHNLTPGMHGSTFGGNPLACAAANATLDVIVNEGLARQAAEKGAYLLGKLKQIDAPVIREVRGQGLMIGIELREKVSPYLQMLQERRILAINSGMTTIRLLPPLVITYPQLDRLITALTEVLNGE